MSDNIIQFPGSPGEDTEEEYTVLACSACGHTEWVVGEGFHIWCAACEEVHLNPLTEWLEDD